MNRGFTTMIAKSKVSFCNESMQRRYDQKKDVKAGAVWSQCWLCFLIVKILCITSVLLKGRLCDAIKGKLPQLRKNSVSPDNASAHASNLQQYFAEHKVVELRQPPYRPDIAFYDFWPFSRLKMVFKGHGFNHVQTIGINATGGLEAIPSTKHQECFQKLSGHWQHVP